MKKSDYNDINDEILRELRAHLGEDNVRVDDDALDEYASDETEDLAFPPEVVVFPRSTKHVSSVMKIASHHVIPVTPRGGGTGLSGGALPIYGGIALTVEQMDRILEIDQKNLMAVVEPGVITQELQEAVEKVGLYYPPDPASRGSCRIGGNLAECAGGPHAVKYGVTKDYVLGVEAVLPDGTLIKHGGKLLKNSTGYNLTQLITGSEGTLAVVTKVYLRLIPYPRCRVTLLVPFPTLESAAHTVPAIMNSGITPSALELMERDAIKITERHLDVTVPNSDAAAQLIVELDGNDESVIEKEAERVCEIAMEEGASDVLLAESSSKQNEIWDMRRATGEAVKSLSVYKEEDTVVPRFNLVPLLTGVKEIAKRHGITTVCYGHAGDGNLHVNILKMDMSDDDWRNNLDVAITEIFELTVSLGGTISGEHGIGYTQKSFLPVAFKTEEIELMKRIKAAFDPRGILNPGKIFPE
ncbi:MAG: FAD-binding protein [Candidatus Latescibacterota bacterium]|nr:MAG: FAD-binding protein [Candidatus Latescibacterota bacterium]